MHHYRLSHGLRSIKNWSLRFLSKHPRLKLAIRSAYFRIFYQYGAWSKKQVSRRRKAFFGLLRTKKEVRLPVFTLVIIAERDLDLKPCFNSIQCQLYPYWNAIVVNPPKGMTGSSSKVNFIFNQNEIYGETVRRCIEMADGDYVAVIDPLSILCETALSSYANSIIGDGSADIIYSDEDKIAGTRVASPFFKPDWSPEYFRSCPYLLRTSFIKTDLAKKQRVPFGTDYSSAYYDLLLNATSCSRNIRHLSAVLFHIAGARDTPTETHELIKVLKNFLNERGFSCDVQLGKVPGTFKVDYPIAGTPRISLLIPTNDQKRDIPGRGSIRLLPNFLRSLQSTTYKNFEIIIADNHNLSDETKEQLQGIPYHLISYESKDDAFNLAKKINFLAKHASGEFLAILNDDLEAIEPGWLTEMLQLAQNPEIGVVGAKLLYPNQKIQHAGMAFQEDGVLAHVYFGFPADSRHPYGDIQVVRNYCAVTGACILTRKNVWDTIGGFDEFFTTDFNDVNYCLSALKAGYRVAYTPYSVLYHFDRSSVGTNPRRALERQEFVSRWKALQARDPYFNPLSLRFNRPTP